VDQIFSNKYLQIISIFQTVGFGIRGELFQIIISKVKPNLFFIIKKSNQDQKKKSS